MIPGLEWDNDVRADGLQIRPIQAVAVHEDGRTEPATMYYIVLPQSNFFIGYCTCCGKPFHSMEYAQETADRLYPFPVRKQ